MRTHFKTYAWKPLEDEYSALYQLLTSDAFKTQGLSGDQIDKTALVIYALLNCQGKIADKSEHFFNLLQDGGIWVHKKIAASDKDLPPVFEKLCGLVSFELFKCQEEVADFYTEEECERLKDQIENVQEDQYLEDIFGMAAYLDTEDWMKAMCKKGSWIFNSVEMRKRLFAAAELESRHE